MKNPAQQIELILKAIYSIFFLLICSLAIILKLLFYPSTIENSVDKNQSSWKLKSLITDIPTGPFGEKVSYGYQLITKTSDFIGPLAKEQKMRYAGNNLSCNNCHLNAGRKIGSGSFVGVTNRYPQFRGRENKTGSMEERINGCMERSMNGKVMPENSTEMQAMIAYMGWLSEGVPGEIEKLYKGYVKVDIPSFKVDTTKGKILYELKCMHCHNKNGEGLKKVGSEFSGYTYPPLGGSDTFNDGAGMNRVITAAEFIIGNMPLGATYDSPQVTDEEAFHIAGYINTFARPKKNNKELDFPDLKLKPVSTPYGPWADNFSSEQHKFGPFPPIISFYKEKYDLVKRK